VRTMTSTLRSRLSGVRGRRPGIRARARGLWRAMVRWTLRAALDCRDAITGRRDPLIPPRRLGLPTQLTAPGERFVTVGLVEAAGLGPDERVLDIGCGPGRIAAQLTRRLTTGSLEGFDVMPDSVQWARTQITPRHPRFRFQLADIQNPRYNAGGSVSVADYRFPYPDDDFDLAFASSVFTHPRPTETERYLRETARVLRPGGRNVSTFFLINAESEELVERESVHVAAAGERRTRSFDYELIDSGGRRFRTSQPRVPEHRIGLYEEDVLSMHEEAGLEVIEIRHGHWCGREQTPGRLGQDLIVSRAR